MIPKVLHMDRLTRQGWRLEDMDFGPDGSVRVVLGKAGQETHFVFEHWEVPAVIGGLTQDVAS